MKTWLKGLLAALLGGAVSGVAAATAGGSVNGSQVKVAAITGAALTVGAYLTRSPVSAPEK